MLKDLLIINGNKIFQYILCYGSTNLGIGLRHYKKIFQYILCYGSTLASIYDSLNTAISIHPMLRFNINQLALYWINFNDFNTSYVTVQPIKFGRKDSTGRFQYILCYGSTKTHRFLFQEG